LKLVVLMEEEGKEDGGKELWLVCEIYGCG
jgi:hypothetical protein